jgi:hypothetical protein
MNLILAALLMIFIGRVDVLASATNNVENPLIGDKTLIEWLPQTYQWRLDRTNNEAVAAAIKAAGPKAQSLLKACLSKDGFTPHKPASADAIENWRLYALTATIIVGTNGAWLTGDLLRMIEERSWKGRDIAISALTFVSPSNPTAVKIAFEDLKSNDAETRLQAVQQLRTVRGSNDAIRALLLAADDSSQKVRDWAIYSLGDFVWDQTVSRKLNEIHTDRTRSLTDQFRAGWALDPSSLRGSQIDLGKALPKRSDGKTNN